MGRRMKKVLVLLFMCVMLYGCSDLPVTSNEIMAGNFVCDGFGGIKSIKGLGSSIFTASPWTQEVVCNDGTVFHMHEDFTKTIVERFKPVK
jgi:hypothetical protein